MPELALIDTHVHFFDLMHPSLTYGWLAPEAIHPILGNIDGIKSTRFEAEHWWAEARFANVTGVVHVQAAVGTPDPVEETRWLDDMHERTGYPNAIVAHADLGRADVEDVLDAHLQSSLIRGVRDFATEEVLAKGDVDETFERGLRALTARDLVLDLDCEWQHMAAAGDLARRHPSLVVVLEHLGFPRSRDPVYFDRWKQGMASLAAAPNVLCKISGIGMRDPMWTLESISPWVRYCVDTFGPERCLVGTNWPVDRLFSSYDAIVNAYRKCLQTYDEDEQSAVLAGNAQRVFKLTAD